MQIDELGTLETPVLITGTLNVLRVADALISYMLTQDEDIGVKETVNPVVPADPGDADDPETSRGPRPSALRSLLSFHRWPLAGCAALSLLLFLPGITASQSGLTLQLSSSTVRQGQAVGVTVVGPVPAGSLQVRFASRTWPLFKEGNQWRTYLGTDPNTTPGTRAVIVEALTGSGPQVLIRRTVKVVRVSFGRRRLTLDPRTLALLDPKLVELERKRVQRALSVLHPAQLWQGPFAVPASSRVTSGYGVLSIYQGQVRGFHRGVDFGAGAGTPVRAANDGIVRLAEMLPVSGNAVLVDHGLGVVTSYLHLSEIVVGPGQHVRKGDGLGRVGSTGLATGPHLHWGLRVNGVHVDPLPWTAQTSR